ncbi:hypothetical protein VH571_14835 [Frondihabitans sp. 4ASC-45]|uniref:hypothetical protein n=1 Tax=Frondihabitans sp. 4ASC-45 TaxID=3111636 RepID=UPI003C289AAF
MTTVARRLVALAVAASAAAALLTGIQVVSAPSPAEALSGSQFDAGNIVSNAVFFDSDALSEAQIQTFLAGKSGTCSNSRCLDILTTTTTSRAADAMCAAYTGAKNETTARIIAKVGRACGINPEVLLVSLQKEQGLVTSTAPSTYAIDRAMGYACPDTGSGCDPAYAGIYNQVYRAAWQFKRYANPAGTSKSFTTYTPGTTVAVRYSPSSPCGTKKVKIANQATANLYYYTPYTPNAAALANLSGTGDSCSAYGNRNFWVYFSNWFGSPTAGTPASGTPAAPVATTTGHVDKAVGGIGTVTLSGWALDRTSTASISVSVAYGASTKTLVASAVRADVGKVYPDSGSKHGFSTTLAASPGSYDVCVTAIGVNKAAKLVSCTPVTVADPSPFGAVDVVRAAPGGILVSGWVADPDTTSSIRARIAVDGKTVRTLAAANSRPDVAKAHPAVGALHGFSTVVPATEGARRVCVTGVNTGRGSDTPVEDCTTVAVLSSSPRGTIEKVSTTLRTITVSGWAIDADTAKSIAVSIGVDGSRLAKVTASAARPGVATSYPAYGAGHGFSATVTVKPGTHTLCVGGINQAGTAGTSGHIAPCRTVTTDTKPKGALDSVTVSKKAVTAKGWAFDPDSVATSIKVDVYIDGKGYRVPTSVARADVARVYKLPGALHGYTLTKTLAKGKHTICAYGIGADKGANTKLGCKAVVVK